MPTSVWLACGPFCSHDNLDFGELEELLVKATQASNRPDTLLLVCGWCGGLCARSVGVATAFAPFKHTVACGWVLLSVRMLRKIFVGGWVDWMIGLCVYPEAVV